jgi:hypothetical protein
VKQAFTKQEAFLEEENRRRGQKYSNKFVDIAGTTTCGGPYDY